MMLSPSPAERLKLTNPVRIQLAAFEKESNAPAQNTLQPRGMPNRFVAQHENRIAT